MNADSKHRDNGPGFRPTISFPEDRLPPQNIEVERSVLAACLLDPAALAIVSGILRPDHFYRDSHETIYASMLRLLHAGLVADLHAVADDLGRRDEFEKVGGLEGLAEIMGSYPHSANAEYHARIIHSKAVCDR